VHPTPAVFEAVFRSSVDALILHDGARLLDCNDAAVQLLAPGRRAGLLDAGLSALLDTGRRDRTWIMEDRPEEAVGVARFRTLGGDTFLAEARTTRLPVEGDLFCLTLRRTTATEALQRALEAREANLRWVLDALPGRMAWIGADRRFRYMNRSFEKLSGYRPDEIIGKTVQEVIGEAAYRTIEPLGAAAMEGQVQHWEGWLPYTSAGRRYVKRTYAPSVRDDGVIDGYFIFSLDLTEQKQAEQALEAQREALYQSEKLNALGSLLAGVAHELNNPLAIVLAQAVLLQELAQDESTRRRSERICAAAERCARIVRSFLAIARQKPPTREPLDIEPLIRSALELTGYGLKANGIEVEIAAGPGVPPVLGDADHLAQVFMNLLINAQHALQERPGDRRIRITTAIDGGDVTVRVADNGPGIPPALAARIFEPFFTTKPQGLGTGIGLSVCRGIVDAHGGALHAEPTPDGGATFVIRLPAAPAEGPEAIDAPSPQDADRIARAILVVDDEPDVADAIAEIVAPLARRVDVQYSGAAAAERLACERFDLVISDLRMPGLDGPALHARIGQGPGGTACPILFVTGDILHHQLEEFLKATGASVVEKPFDPTLLRERVEAMLRPHREA